MATRPDITGAPTRAPSIRRRALLGAFAASPIAALPAAHALASPSTSPWRTAYAAYLRAKDEDETYDRLVWLPRHAATERMIAKVPHHAVSYLTLRDEPAVMSTAVPRDVSTARGMLRALKNAQTDYMKACREVADAAEKRETELRRIRNLPAMREADERGEALADAKWEALHHAFEAPCATMGELVEKMTLVEDEECYDCPDTREAMLADARRLAGGRA